MVTAAVCAGSSRASATPSAVPPDAERYQHGSPPTTRHSTPRRRAAPAPSRTPTRPAGVDRGLALVAVEERWEVERAVAARGLAHVAERALAALAALEVRERLVEPLALELTIEVLCEQRQEGKAGLGEALGVDLRKPNLDPKALAGAEDQLRDGVLLETDDLADLGIGAVLELSQGKHEPLPRLELPVGDANVSLLASQELARSGSSSIAIGAIGSGTSAIGSARLLFSTCL